MIESLWVRRLSIRFNWLKGHQDEEQQSEDLTREALLNIDCDLCAGMMRSEPPLAMELRPCSVWYPADGATVMIGGVRVTKRIRDRAVKEYTLLALVEYLRDRNEWSEEGFSLIDWTGMCKALEAETHGLHIRVVKMQHEWLNVGAQRVKINPLASDACLCCRQAGKRMMHLLTCDAEVMATSKRVAIEEFKNFVGLVRTSPLILHTLIKAVQTVMNGRDLCGSPCRRQRKGEY